MKRNLMIIAACMLGMGAAQAQTLHIPVGQVEYLIPETAGEMTFSNGATLTAYGKEYALSEVGTMYVDDTPVTDNLVSVVYKRQTAAVQVAGNVAQYLTVTVSGADVTIAQSADLAQEITYALSGSSTAGSFTMSGSYKATLALTDLTLTSTTGAAISIANGKRIDLVINGTNTLVDAANGDQKACFFIKGHPEISGAGTLTLTGNTKHAYKSNEYTQLKKKFTGSIIVKSAVSDGLHIGQYLQMNNGTITVQQAGDDGIQVEATADDDELDGQCLIAGGTINVTVATEDTKGIKSDSLMVISDDLGNNTTINITCTSAANAAKGLKSGTEMQIKGGTITISTAGGGIYKSETVNNKTTYKVSACSCIKADETLTVSGGTLKLSSTGGGGKGMSGDGVINITGGDITITTSGNMSVYQSSKINNSYTSDADRISTNLKSSPKGIKADGNVNISGGSINITTTGAGGEGIESKNEMYITGGTIEVLAYDDAINTSSNMYLQGGLIYARSTNNDGIDSNASIFISGGTIVAYSNTTPETAIDVDSPGYLQITGGTVLAVGLSSNMVPYPKSTSTQPSIFYTGSLSETNYALVGPSSTIMAFKPEVTAGSNNGGGNNRWMPAAGPGGGGPGGQGGGSSMCVMISSPDLAKGSAYTLYSGSTVSGELWHGLYIDPSVTSNGSSAGSVSSLSSPYSSMGSSSSGGNNRW